MSDMFFSKCMHVDESYLRCESTDDKKHLKLEYIITICHPKLKYKEHENRDYSNSVLVIS